MESLIDKKDYSFEHNIYGKVNVTYKYDDNSKYYIVEYKTKNINADKLTIYLINDINRFLENDDLKRKVLNQYHDFICNDSSKDELIENSMESLCDWLDKYKSDDFILNFENKIRLDGDYNIDNIFISCSYRDKNSNIFTPITYNIEK